MVALGTHGRRVKSTGRSFRSEFSHVFTVQNGKIVKFQEYFDTQAAVDTYRRRRNECGALTRVSRLNPNIFLPWPDLPSPHPG